MWALHDVVEDTQVTSLAIREQFGDRVTGAVDGITRRAGQDPDHYDARVAENPEVLGRDRSPRSAGRGETRKRVPVPR